MLTVTTSISIGHLIDRAAHLANDIQQVCDKAVLDIEADAKQRCPVRTGFLRRSIYSVTSKGSSYTSEGDSLPPTPRAPGISAVVGVAAPYGLYVDQGTHRMPAQPYMTPAIEAERPRLIAALNAVVK